MNKTKKTLMFWIVGCFFATILILFQWFTGWNKYGTDSPSTFRDLLLLLKYEPHKMIVSILFFGAICGGILYYLIGRKD